MDITEVWRFVLMLSCNALFVVVAVYNFLINFHLSRKEMKAKVALPPIVVSDLNLVYSRRDHYLTISLSPSISRAFVLFFDLDLYHISLLSFPHSSFFSFLIRRVSFFIVFMRHI